MREILLFCLFLCFCIPVSRGQPGDRHRNGEAYPVVTTGHGELKGRYYFRNYTHAEYKAGVWNYNAVQDRRGVMYFSNGKGILEFNGANWQVIKIARQSQVRWIATDSKGQVYAGANGEFGYLKINAAGQAEYVSLSKLLSPADRNFTTVLFIATLPEGICFVTAGAVFIWKDGYLTVKRTGMEVLAAFTVNEKLYLHLKDTGLMLWKNGKLNRIQGGEQFINQSIIALLPFGGDKILVATGGEGFFIYDGQMLRPWESASHEFAANNEITCGTVLADGNFAFGTRQNGLLIIDKAGFLYAHLNETQGLPSNTINGIYKDNYHNLWLCLDNGISHVQYNSPFSVFDERRGLKGGVLGIFYTGKDVVYATTAQGIFYMHKNSYAMADANQFRMIGKGEASTIQEIRGEYMASTREGIVQLIDSTVRPVTFQPQRIWKLLSPVHHPSTLLAGTTSGILLLEKTRRSYEWNYRGKIKNFAEIAPLMEQDPDGNIWVSNRKGLFRLKLNSRNDSVIAQKIYGVKKGLPGESTNRIYKINNKIIAATRKGVFFYQAAADSFAPYLALNSVLGKLAHVNYIIQDHKGNIWLQENDSIFGNQVNFVHAATGLAPSVYKTPFLKFKGIYVEQILPIDDHNVLFATADGIIHYDPSKKIDYKSPYPALIRKIESTTGKDSLLFGGIFIDDHQHIVLEQLPAHIPSFPYDLNALRFSFSATYYEEIESIQYQSMLIGLDKHWSEWTNKPEKEYTNLHEGEYTFLVRAKNIYQATSTVASYKFKILPPWYRSWWAYITYGALGIIMVQGMMYVNTRRLVRQKRELARIVAQRTTQVVEQKKEIEKKKEEIEKKNQNIESSIRYAKRIQDATLPNMLHMAHVLPKAFILYKPRDIVSGDFYWFAEIKQEGKKPKVVVAAVDCTGHGVPGAFMSLIGDSLLTNIVCDSGITQADQILNEMHKGIRRILNQGHTDNRDGMDMALCVIDLEDRVLDFAGAKNPIILFQNRRMKEIKGNKVPIGGLQKEQERTFTSHRIIIAQPTMLYMFTDGYRDQFGGEENKKYSIKRLRALLNDIHEKPMHEQRYILNKEIETWKKGGRQIDDILVWGLKI